MRIWARSVGGFDAFKSKHSVLRRTATAAAPAGTMTTFLLPPLIHAASTIAFCCQSGQPRDLGSLQSPVSSLQSTVGTAPYPSRRARSHRRAGASFPFPSLPPRISFHLIANPHHRCSPPPPLLLHRHVKSGEGLLQGQLRDDSAENRSHSARPLLALLALLYCTVLSANKSPVPVPMPIRIPTLQFISGICPRGCTDSITKRSPLLTPLCNLIAQITLH